LEAAEAALAVAGVDLAAVAEAADMVAAGAVSVNGAAGMAAQVAVPGARLGAAGEPHRARLHRVRQCHGADPVLGWGSAWAWGLA